LISNNFIVGLYIYPQGYPRSEQRRLIQQWATFAAITPAQQVQNVTPLRAS
jgi:hypothetical protein